MRVVGTRSRKILFFALCLCSRKGKSTYLDYFRYENGLPEVQSGLIDFRAQCAHFTKITNFPCFSFPPSPSVFSSFGGFSLLRIFFCFAHVSPQLFQKFQQEPAPTAEPARLSSKISTSPAGSLRQKKPFSRQRRAVFCFFHFLSTTHKIVVLRKTTTPCQDPQSTGEDTHLHLHTLLRGTNSLTLSLLIHASAPVCFLARHEVFLAWPALSDGLLSPNFAVHLSPEFRGFFLFCILLTIF